MGVVPAVKAGISRQGLSVHPAVKQVTITERGGCRLLRLSSGRRFLLVAAGSLSGSAIGRTAEFANAIVAVGCCRAGQAQWTTEMVAERTILCGEKRRRSDVVFRTARHWLARPSLPGRAD